MIHTFTQSGLGEAPFTVVHPNTPKARKNTAFYCEHCGTMLKNRFFVQSSDGKVSVVGIDCLNKAGDLGLIDSAKVMRRQLRQEERQARIDQQVQEREAADRKKFGGQSRQEVIDGLEASIKEAQDRHYEVVFDHPANRLLSGHDNGSFMENMRQQAFDGKPFSQGMLSALVGVFAKKQSGARKNSKAYKAALPDAQALADDYQAVIEQHYAEVEAIKAKIRDLKQGW